MNTPEPHMLISGASSGIGEATARLAAGRGWRLSLGARRLERLQALAEKLQRAHGASVYVAPLDVRRTDSVQAFLEGAIAAQGVPTVLVNNAGLALGLRPLWETPEEDYETMWQTNVAGVIRLTQAVLPHMLRQGRGHIVMLGSIAGWEAYEGGSIYCATKFALRALTQSLRQELLGTPIRLTSIDPGMVETEFSLVRFRGDRERARKVYEGLTPLTGEDVARCILWAVEQPEHVNIDTIILKPRDQASMFKVHRRA
ncbi:MAG: SDR family NAD(P)-dependent oxidoreductase [Bacteroidota bacterium]|nr:SDR family NAD(P)-dependent oxidoreductase [Bacteroidota bacterium]MDW8138254.1 SDR family NAD(P)-dependent oxidoreductase [Bacteroidota bacterium]